MDPKRWREVERLCQAALEMEPGKRDAYMKEACAGDESLKKEVEALLAHQSEARAFMEDPAMEAAARALAREQEDAMAKALIGRTIAHYRIVEKIGQGGMGVVYSAEDTSLHRRVAVKVLPEEFVGDAERLARFQREAEVLASLNHPNIATLYSLEESEGKRFIVMELVEGETLSQRLSKGPLPVNESLRVCRLIAEGLDATHEKGIIHRDLKPGNVMIIGDDEVKVLDFGLAKSLPTQGPFAGAEVPPTITDVTTRKAVILGTAGYMSPEQARGKRVDKRADIWAFGCVLFECLTGRAPFKGETVTETLVKILETTPDWDLLPAATTWRTKELLRRCLEKDPRQRLHDIADARIELGEAGGEAPSTATVARRTPVMWLVAGGVTILLVGILVDHFLFRHPPAPAGSTIVRSVIKLEPGRRLAGMNLDPWYKLPTRTAMTISGDGHFVIYSASEEGPGPETNPQLYIRRTDRMESKAIPGTQGGISPFLPPDDRWVGFWAEGKLMKVPIDGSVPTKLCDSGMPFGASWGRDNSIVFSIHESLGLFRVSGAGGKPEALTTPDKTKEEWSHRLPCYLPDGRSVIFTIMREVYDIQPRVALLDLRTGKWNVLIEDAADARYVPTGHLVFVRQGTLMCVPFDLEKLQIGGQPVPAIANVMQALNYATPEQNAAAGQFSISDSGWLVYASGGTVPDWQNALVWVDQKGNAQPAALPKGPICTARLWPDGRRIAYSTFGREWQVWVYDLDRGTSSRLTGEGRALWSTWTPDGKRVFFGWHRTGDRNIFWQAADGSSPMEQLTTSVEGRYSPGSCSPDGTTVAFVAKKDTGVHIRMLDVQSRRVTPFLNSQSHEGYPEFSPDGRWLAYVSDETGQWEVYVRSFPGPGGKWQISNDGGSQPLWSRDGKRLFYRRLPNQVLVADIQAGSTLSPGKPRLLFEKSGYLPSDPIRSWDISVDGRRFLMVKGEEMKPQPVTEMILVMNWFEELKRLCPTK